jgi:Protein of unknown function (DUF3553)
MSGPADWKPGIWVRHPKQESWGIGRVIACEDEKLRILFPAVGEKVVDTRYATLESLEAPAGSESVRHQITAQTSVDMIALEKVCNAFHEQFRDRRKTTDDGRMAVRVLEDMKANGDLSKRTAQQLFAWTQTGVSYTQGVDLAQEICRLIYGRGPTRAEIEAAGF